MVDILSENARTFTDQTSMKLSLREASISLMTTMVEKTSQDQESYLSMEQLILGMQ